MAGNLLERWIDSHVIAPVFDKAFFNLDNIRVHRGEKELIASRERKESQIDQSNMKKKKKISGSRADVLLTYKNLEFFSGESKRVMDENSSLVKQDYLKLQVIFF